MSMKNLSFTELAEVVSSRTKKINEYLSANGLPQPSFAADAPDPDFLPIDVDQEIHKARIELMEASKLIGDLAAGSGRLLLTQAVNPNMEASVQRTVAAFRIPEHVPLQGSITYAELSKACGLEEEKLRRVLSYSYLINILREAEPGRVAHTSLSKILATSRSAMDLLSHATDDLLPGAASQTAALKKWFTTSNGEPLLDNDPAHCGMALAFGIQENLFSFWSNKQPERHERFIGAMKFAASNRIFTPREVETGFDWASLGPGLVVDMGGNSGHVSVNVADEAPQLRFLIQDLPAVVEGAAKQMDERTKKLHDSGRLQYQAHDFFTPQPNTEADVYFMRRVLHDWPDSECIKIIANIVPSMKPGSRIVINDFILPQPGTLPVPEELGMRLTDLTMMMAMNAKERAIHEWEDVFERGSGGKLKMESAKGSILSFVKPE